MRRAATGGVITSFLVAVLILGTPASAGPSRGAVSIKRMSGTAKTTGSPNHSPGYRPLHADAYARAKQRAYEAATSQGNANHKPPPPPPPPAGPGWNGQYETDLTPPDPTGAMGPTEYIELINLRYGIYRRDQSLIASGTLGELTGHNNFDLSDPQILWDAPTQRFYYSAVDVVSDTYAFGYSTTATPSGPGDFCQYDADFGFQGFYLPDYPKLGDSSDFIIIGANVFAGGFSYVGSDIDWIKKPPAGPCQSGLGGGWYSNVSNADGSQMSTPVPAVQTDPSGTGWVVGTADVSTGSASGFITARSITRDAQGNAALGPPVAVRVAESFNVPPNAPERGSRNLLDTLDGRLERAVAAPDPGRGGIMAVWTAHAVAGGAGAEERWYEIDPASGAVLQSGKATSSSLYVWNGAVSPDRAYDSAKGGTYGSSMVMGFSTSSSSAYPAIQMVTKVGSSPLSSFLMIKQASGPNVDSSCSPCRWGDYSGASPDPDPPGTTGQVWLSGEWNVANANGGGVDWRTWNWSATP